MTGKKFSSKVSIGDSSADKNEHAKVGVKLPPVKSPTEKVVLPFSGKEVVIKPFTLQAEKAILVARERVYDLLRQKEESGIEGTTREKIEAAEELLRVIGEITSDSVVSPSNFNAFNEFVGDVEFLFARIRAISAGENLSIVIKCPYCEKENSVSVDIKKVSIETDKSALDHLKVKIPVERGWVELISRPPTYADFIEISKINSDENALFLADYLWVTVEEGITSDGDAFIPREEVTLDEWRTWVSTIPSFVVSDIMEGISKFKYSKCAAKLTCPNCKNQFETDLCGEDVGSFFT